MMLEELTPSFSGTPRGRASWARVMPGCVKRTVATSRASANFFAGIWMGSAMKVINLLSSSQICPMRRIFIVLVFGSLCLSGIAQAPADTVQVVTPGRTNDPAQEQKPYVIMISADGFRHDLAEKCHATTLLMLASTGVRTPAMKPSYPSVTFPNHYTLATGLYPSHHGLVDNTFYDTELGEGYTIGKQKAVTDPRFYGGIPIWVLAEQQK